MAAAERFLRTVTHEKVRNGSQVKIYKSPGRNTYPFIEKEVPIVQVTISNINYIQVDMLQVPRCKLVLSSTIFSPQLKTECAFRIMVSLGRRLRHPIRMSASNLITHCLGPDMQYPKIRFPVPACLVFIFKLETVNILICLKFKLEYNV